MTQRTPPENGYGYVTQTVMRNPDISKIAKAIYGVIAVFADPDSWRAYPSTKYIRSILKLTVAAFRKHRQQLIDAKLITFKFERNQAIYTVAVNQMLADGYGSGSGYGFIPKSVMLDSTLSRNARVLYAYLASFAGMQGTAYPSVETIQGELGMNKDTFYCVRGELIKRDLLQVVHRSNDDKSKYLPNVYSLNENKRILGNTKQLATTFYWQPNQTPADCYRMLYDDTELTLAQQRTLNQYAQYGNDWINMALYKARYRNQNFSYAVATMQTWVAELVETIDDIREYDSEFYQRLRYDGSN